MVSIVAIDYTNYFSKEKILDQVHVSEGVMFCSF